MRVFYFYCSFTKKKTVCNIIRMVFTVSLLLLLFCFTFFDCFLLDGATGTVLYYERMTCILMYFFGMGGQNRLVE